MSLASGLGLMFLGLLAWLAGTHFKALRFFDRPPIARAPWFDPILRVLAWVLVPAGLVLIARTRPAAGSVTTLVLLGLWVYRRSIRSVPFQRRLLRRDLEALRRRHPGEADKVLLCRLVYRRHPGWGEELIEQMVFDYPTVDDLARVLAKMEKGFRGFRP
jgi:hypothetical protein